MDNTEKTIREILGDRSSLWCGCWEGDMDNTFPDKLEGAVAALKNLIDDEVQRALDAALGVSR